MLQGSFQKKKEKNSFRIVYLMLWIVSVLALEQIIFCIAYTKWSQNGNKMNGRKTKTKINDTKQYESDMNHSVMNSGGRRD